MDATRIFDSMRIIHARPLRKHLSDGNLDRRDGKLIARDLVPIDKAAWHEGLACRLCSRLHSARTRRRLHERNQF